MALPDFFGRNARAAAQVLTGFDPDVFAQHLDQTSVGVAFGSDARTPEGEALLDLTVRLLARLYPRIALLAAEGTDREAAAMAALAKRINPRIEVTEEDPALGLTIGTRARDVGKRTYYLGSHGWSARFSSARPQEIGATNVPFGGALAASLGAANLFREIFMPGLWSTDAELDLSVAKILCLPEPDTNDVVLHQPATLVGAGAIGNAAIWALARSSLHGTVRVVDPESVELSNMQRYILTERADDGTAKALVAARGATANLSIEPHIASWREFAAKYGNASLDRVLVAVDTAKVRREVQATLPRWIANGWTQTGDLGVSRHEFLAGACLSCLYLPQGVEASEDQIIADALAVPHRLEQIRELLHSGAGTPREILDEIARRLNVNPDDLAPFEARPIREIYTVGICGGAIVTINNLGGRPADAHVPLAHQSALAGILVAATVLLDASGAGDRRSFLTRMDVTRPLPPEFSMPAQKDPRGLCICQDPTYRRVYLEKHPIEQFDQHGDMSAVVPN